jgi:hypothetical protein
MTTQLTHLEQYKTLREEILRVLDDMHRTEFWAAAAIGAIYAWLFGGNVPKGSGLWWIGPLLIFLAGLRYLLLFDRVRTIAVYLRQIEKETFGNDATLPGWERYSWDKGGGQRIILTTSIAWVSVFLVSLAITFWPQVK